MEIVFLVIGLAVGGVAAWILFARRSAQLAAQLAGERERAVHLSAELEVERRSATSQADAYGQLETTLKALSADLQKDAREDLESRQRAMSEYLAPLREQLERVSNGMQELEKARSASHGALSAEIRGLVEAQARLQGETANLASAMRATGVRGSWGEMQLRRILELAGMVAYCDFDLQRTATAEDRRLRPDVVVRLPGGLNLVVDAKTPFDAYMRASNTTDEALRGGLLQEHAKAVRGHVASLSAKGYSEPFQPTPGFVVLFIPAEPLFQSALEHDASLFEDAIRQGVLLASPATLIAVLRAAAEGWRQEKVADHARKVSELGKQLYDRLAVLAGHFTRLGKGLDNAVGAYNDAIGSLERQVLVSARRFPDLGVSAGREIPELEPIQHATRAPQAPELQSREPIAPIPGGEDDPQGVLDAA